LTEHHECFSRLVYLPARRKDVFPCHDFDSPFIDEDGSRVLRGGHRVSCRTDDRVPRSNGAARPPQTEVLGSHGFAQEAQQPTNLIWLMQHRHGCSQAFFARMNRYPLLRVDCMDLPNQL
jgi:hypothetical protein